MACSREVLSSSSLMSVLPKSLNYGKNGLYSGEASARFNFMVGFDYLPEVGTQ